MKIYIASPKERDDVVMILAHNGYTVRQGKDRVGNKNLMYVEVWKDGENHSDGV